MSTSAEPLTPPRLRSPDAPVCSRRAEQGFTLLEVMVTLAIVAAAIMPLLVVRDAAWNISYRSGHMLRAAAYAEEILAERMTDPDDVKQYQAEIEDDPSFSYEITIETYDLATGRVETPEDELGGADSNFSTGMAFSATDMEAAPEEEDEDNPHRERRFTLHIRYPGLKADEPETYTLEGYLPMAKKDEDDAQSGPK